MIQIVNKESCSGCTACYNICPKKCIKMKQDEEGFLYPEVDKEKCVNCELCETICPLKQKKVEDDEKKVEFYVMTNKNKQIKKESTSGGIFSVFAKKIIEEKGIVFGAVFNDDFVVIHKGIETIEGLQKFRGSKYVQSKLGDVFVQVKEELDRQRKVLFSGTPCQVAGLKAFLRKDYENLYCIDLVCRGVPSPMYFEKYKEQKIKSQKSNINKIAFREKTYGYSSSTMSIYFENGKEYHNGHESDEMIKAFMKGLCSKPACYKCNFKTIYRPYSDITLGDFWNPESIEPKEEFTRGATLVIVQSNKAKELVDLVKNEIYSKKIDYETAILHNGNGKKEASLLIRADKKPPQREEFLRDAAKLDFRTLKKKYLQETMKEKTKEKLKPIFYKMGILEKIKKHIKSKGEG